MERIYKGPTKESFTRPPQPRRRAFRRLFLLPHMSFTLTSRLGVYTVHEAALSAILQLQGRTGRHLMGGHSKTAIIS